jgi:hypothetical protein
VYDLTNDTIDTMSMIDVENQADERKLTTILIWACDLTVVVETL